MAKATFSPQQKKILITILLVLAALRFLGVPFLAYQAEQKVRLELTSQQLGRALRLVNNEADIAEVQALQKQLQSLENSYIKHTNSNEFRLTAQQQIQSMVANYNVEVHLFDWLTQREVLPNYLYTHQARTILQGELADVIQAQLAIQEQIYGVKVLEFALQEQRSHREPSVRLTLLLDVTGVQKKAEHTEPEVTTP